MPYKPKKGETPPTHQPTLETRANVEAMVVNGCTIAQIAGVLDMCPNTLQKHYAHELKHAKSVLDMKVTRRFKAFMFDEEVDDRVALDAIKHYSNAKMGWKQQAQVDQNTTFTVDEALVDQIKNMDFDNIIALGKGLDKLEGQ